MHDIPSSYREDPDRVSNMRRCCGLKQTPLRPAHVGAIEIFGFDAFTNRRVIKARFKTLPSQNIRWPPVSPRLKKRRRRGVACPLAPPQCTAPGQRLVKRLGGTRVKKGPASLSISPKRLD